MKKRVTVLLSALALAFFAARPAPAEEKKDEPKMHKMPSGLQYEDVRVGTGAQPKTGQTCVVKYTGWLWENGAKGRKFESSVYEFPLGQGQVIKGWDEGIATMKVGGKRTLLIPPALGYGARGGGGGMIPPNATLLFDLELLGVK